MSTRVPPKHYGKCGLIACEINQMLPSEKFLPKQRTTKAFIICAISPADVEKATLKYICQRSLKEIFTPGKNHLKLIEKLINEKYGKGTVKLTLERSI